MAKKILTFSFDDGITQDVRLAELFNKYGMKCTFNLNSGYFGRSGELTVCDQRVSHNKVKAEDVKSIYAGHEVAAHTLTHPLLPKESKEAVIRQVEQDRLNLSELCGYEVVGFAYPCGGKNYSEEVAEIIKENTGVKYARTIECTNSFGISDDMYIFKPTLRFIEDAENAYAVAQRFLNTDKDALFYIWGHSYEFDALDRWGNFEEFLKYLANKADVLYLTNKEAFEELGKI